MIVRIEIGNTVRVFAVRSRRSLDGPDEYMLTEHGESDATVTVETWSYRPTPAQVLRKIAEIYELEKNRDPPRRKKYQQAEGRDG